MNIGNDQKKVFYTIGEVSQITEIKTTVLRFWEEEFDELKPQKNKFGHRVYSEEEINLILKIKELLYKEGLTIKGAKNILLNSKKSNNLDIKIIKNKLEELLKLLK